MVTTAINIIIRRGFQELGARGFHLRGRRWCRIGDQTTTIVELQKSNHANCYFTNVAVILRDLEDLPCGPFNKAHTYGRWSDGDAERALSFSNELGNDERVEVLSTAVRGRLVPLLISLESPQAVRDIHQGPLTSVIMLPVARDWLAKIGEG